MVEKLKFNDNWRLFLKISIFVFDFGWFVCLSIHDLILKTNAIETVKDNEKDIYVKIK